MTLQICLVPRLNYSCFALSYQYGHFCLLKCGAHLEHTTVQSFKNKQTIRWPGVIEILVSDFKNGEQASSSNDKFLTSMKRSTQ